MIMTQEAKEKFAVLSNIVREKKANLQQAEGKLTVHRNKASDRVPELEASVARYKALLIEAEANLGAHIAENVAQGGTI